MVDWPTVALSASGSLAGILLTILLERRREDMRQREALHRRQDALDQRLRDAEVDIAILRPAGRFFSESMQKDKSSPRWRPMSLTPAHRKELETLMDAAIEGRLDAAKEAQLRVLLDMYNPGAAQLPRKYLIESGGIQLGADILLEKLFPEPASRRASRRARKGTGVS